MVLLMAHDLFVIPDRNVFWDIAMSLASVRPSASSVRLSICKHFVSALYNLNIVQNVLMILKLYRTGHDDVSVANESFRFNTF